MKIPLKLLSPFLVVVLTLILFTNFSKTSAAKEEASLDEIIVKYKPQVREEEKVKVRSEHKTSLKEKIPKLGLEVVKVPSGKVDEFVEKHKKNSLVEYAEPNYIAQAFGTTNDSSLSQQWGLYKINAANNTGQSAWDISSGSSNVRIAILDSGIEQSHPDLGSKIVQSANFTTNSSSSDQNGHGTHAAGIAGAMTNNGSGVAGVGYNSSLMNGKVLADDGSGYYSWIVNGITWASDNGANVISMSLGGTASSQALQDAVNYAWGKGVVLVAAAGNSGSTSRHYPAYYSNVIAVAATDQNDKKANWSNYGSWVDVAAPGVNIYSTYKGNSYSLMSGTSMATPFVAGQAALIFGSGACSTNTCVREKIEKTADPIPGTGSSWAWGRVNAYKALSGQSITTPTATPTRTPTPTLAVTAIPTPTNAPTSAATSTPIPTQAPSPASSLTVGDIQMWQNTLFLSYRRVYTQYTVRDVSSNVPISSAYVKANITTPSGMVTQFSGYTNSSGQVSFNIFTQERGTFTTTVTSVAKSSYVYESTLTSSSLVIQ